MRSFFFALLGLLAISIPSVAYGTDTNFGLNGNANGAATHYVSISADPYLQAYDVLAEASINNATNFFGGADWVNEGVLVTACIFGNGADTRCYGPAEGTASIALVAQPYQLDRPYGNYTTISLYATYYCTAQLTSGGVINCTSGYGGGVSYYSISGNARGVSINSMSAPISADVGQSFTVSWAVDQALDGVSISSSANISCGAISGSSVNCVGTSVANGSVTLTAQGPLHDGQSYNTRTITSVKNIDIRATGGSGDPPPPPPPNNYTLTVTKSGTGAGTVTSSPAGINCGSTCAANYVNGTSVTLTATAGSGSTFAGWSGSGCSGTGNCTVSMTQARSVTATFNGAACANCAQFISQTINGVLNPGNLSLTLVAGQTYPVSVVFKNTGTNTWTCCSPAWNNGDPFSNLWNANGYKLGNLVDPTPWGSSSVRVKVPSNTAQGSNATFSYNITAPATPGNYRFQNRMVQEFVAFFGDSSSYIEIQVVSGQALTVTKAGTGSGTVNSGSSPLPVINCGSTCSGSYPSGTSITLSATASAGSVFAGWSGSGCSGTGSCTVSMTQARSVTATFNTIGPSIVSTSITPSPASVNASTQHTITVVASHPVGGSNIHYQYGIINHQGTNTGQYRGYLVWSTGSWGATQKDNQACTGGGYGALLIASPYEIYGSQYLELVGCSTSVSGNNRTVTFTVTFNNANSGSGASETRAFTSPLSNNTISGYARDNNGVVAGWVAGATFSISLVPGVTSVSVSPNPVTPNGAMNHTITAVGSHLGGGANIDQFYVISNYQGANAGQYRGYLTWATSNAWPTHKDNRACTGGGYAAIQSEGGQSVYGPQYIELESCSTSVSGNNRTLNLVVRFNTNFTTPTTNNLLSGQTRAGGGNFSGWISGSTYSLVQSFNYTLTPSSGTVNVTKGSGTVNVQNTITKTLTAGTGEAVTLNVSGLPSGVSVQSITNQGCAPTCSSVITFAVTSSAPTGNHTITVTGSPLNNTATFTLNISGNPMSVSCSASPATVLVGQPITWTANVSGGTGPYTYSWSGSEGLAGTSASIVKTYSTIGQKTATVTVTDDDSLTAQCSPAGTAQVYFNPVFEEF